MQHTGEVLPREGASESGSSGMPIRIFSQGNSHNNVGTVLSAPESADVDFHDIENQYADIKLKIEIRSTSDLVNLAKSFGIRDDVGTLELMSALAAFAGAKPTNAVEAALAVEKSGLAKLFEGSMKVLKVGMTAAKMYTAITGTLLFPDE